MITKSNYLVYLHCEKRLWLEQYLPGQAPPPNEAARRRMQAGQQVDRLARACFPEGRLIPYRPQPQEMATLTREAIDAGADTIFQATVAAEDLLIKADILVREGQSWRLIEVKSSLTVKDEHLHDVSFQLHVLERAGFNVKQINVMHLNKECRHPDLDNLFTLTDVTEQARELAPQVMLGVVAMRETLAGREPAPIDIGRHCSKPGRCPLYQLCWSDSPGLSIYDIAHLNRAKEQQLRDLGVIALADVPGDFPLTPNQRTFVDFINQRQVCVDKPAIRAQLAQLEYPLHFFDFETIDHAVPAYAGCWPYYQVPFQYSCHVLHQDGALEHREYLYTGAGDPRPSLIALLLRDIGERGHVVVYYAPFERKRLQDLAAAFPESAEQLLGIAGRLWDQLDIFKSLYRHHGFGKSNSLKSVLPVIVPELSYDSLAVQNGEQAQVIWEKMIACWDSKEKEQLATDLRRYCHLDTYAMVKMHEVLASL